MAFPNVVIKSKRNGATEISGAREDLLQGEAITVELSSTTGMSTFKWEMRGRPEYSTAGGVGINPWLLSTTSGAGFTVDTDGAVNIDGTYVIACTVNAGAPSQTTFTTILARVATGMTIPGTPSSRNLRKLGMFESLEDTISIGGGVIPGWSTMANRWFELLAETVAGGGGGGGAPTNASYLTLTANGPLSAERVFTMGAGLSGVDGGANTTYTLSIANAGVTSAMLRNSVGVSVIGRTANSTGVPADIAASADGQFLSRHSGALAFTAIADADIPATLMRTSWTLTAGAGLAGGGDGSANRTISMPNTGPGAGLIGGTGIASITLDAQGRVTAAATGSYGAGGAPASAQYWVGAADGTLTNELNLGVLATGLVKNTAGVPSIAVVGTDYAAAYTIALGQVAYATGANAIGGDTLLTYAAGALSVGVPEATIVSSPRIGAFGAASAHVVAREVTNNVEAWIGADSGGAYIGASSNHSVYVMQNNIGRGRVNSSGYWRIGDSVSAVETLESAGAVFATGARNGSSGSGVSIDYLTNVGYIACATWPGTYRQLVFEADSFQFVANGITNVWNMSLSGGVSSLAAQNGTSNIDFGAGTRGAPSSFDNYKVIAYRGASASVSYGIGADTSSLWLNTAGLITFHVNGTNYGSVDNTGKWMFGSASVPVEAVQSAGAVFATGAQVAATGSGLSLGYASSIGKLTSVSWGSTFRELQVQSETLTVQCATSGALESVFVARGIRTSGALTQFTFTGSAHTGLTASTEAIGLDVNLNQTVQHATGALATQRAMVVRAPTYSFVGASTITNTATLAITGAPIAGTNATITNTWALDCGGNINLSEVAATQIKKTGAGDLSIVLGVSGYDMSFEGPDDSTQFRFKSAGIERVRLDAGCLKLLCNSAAIPAIDVTAYAGTGLSAGDEHTDVYLNLNRTTQASTGGVTNQRSVYITAPTLSYVGASTIANVSTVAISGAPNAGANATFTRRWALSLEAGKLYAPEGIATQVIGFLPPQDNSGALGIDFFQAGASNTTYPSMQLVPTSDAATGVNTASLLTINGNPASSSTSVLRVYGTHEAYDPVVGYGRSVFHAPSSTLTFNGAAQTTLGGQYVVRIDRQTITRSNSNTYTIATGASLYIENNLNVTGGPTITDNYALHVDAGISRFDGDGTYVLELPADATGNVSVATGRVPIKIGGATKYLRYYDS